MQGKTNVSGAKLFGAIGVTYPAGSILTCTMPNIVNASGELVNANGILRTDAITSLLVNIEPKQTGTGWPQPDNIRPISGWTGATVTRAGKNLIKITATSRKNNGVNFTFNEDGSVTVDGTVGDASTQSFVNFRADTTYSTRFFPPGDYIISGGKEDVNIQIIVDSLVVATSALGGEAKCTVPEDAVNSWARIQVQGKGTTIENVTVHPMVRAASDTDSTFEPYSATAYSTDWSAEAGTVYGGTFDVFSGVLTVDRAMVDMGALDYCITERTELGFKYFWSTSLNTTATNYPTPVCSHYSYNANVTATNGNSKDLTQTIGDTGNFFIRDDRFYESTAEEFKAEMSGVQLVYALKNPLTYQLAPQQISSLLGTNNVWADTGEISIGYLSNGTKTLKAKTTTGQWVFAIPEAGTWTVTATDGTNTKSQEVAISTEGQWESVELSYELVLFDEVDGLMSGCSFNNTSVTPAIDVTEYSTIEMYGQLTWHSSASLGVSFGLSQTANGSFVASVNILSTTNQTYTLDVSKLTGLYYFTASYPLSISNNRLMSSAQDSGGVGATVKLDSVIFK